MTEHRRTKGDPRLGFASGGEHLTEIHRSLRAEGGTRAWFAVCACGWERPQRTTPNAAENDCLANEDDS